MGNDSRWTVRDGASDLVGARHEWALRSLRCGTWFWDRRQHIVHWDAELERLYGLEEGTFGGRFEDWLAMIHPPDREPVLAALEAVLEGGEDGHEVTYRSVDLDGEVRWIETHACVLRESDEVVGMVGACRDVTARVEADRAHQRELEAERASRTKLEFLTEIGSVLNSSLEPAEVLDRLSALAVPSIADLCAVCLLDECEALRVVVARHSDPSVQPVLDELVAGRPQVRDPQILEAVANDEPFLASSVRAEGDRGPTEQAGDRVDLLQRLELTSVAVVPLQVRRHGLGALVLAMTRGTRRFAPVDLPFVREVASHAALAIDNARAHTDRTQLAEQLQRALESRVVIEQAKGYLAARRGVDPADAFEDLRAMARSSGRRIHDVAQAVLAERNRSQRPPVASSAR